MDERKFNFHYYFGFKHIPMVVYKHYDFFKQVVEHGPTSMRKFLIEEWGKQSERLKERYENLELLNNQNADHPFDFSLVKREGKGDLFSIYMPPMAPPTDTAMDCVILTIVMNESNPVVYVCEYDDYTIKKMKEAGAPPELSEPHFIAEKITPEAFIMINKSCQKFSDYFAAIEADEENSNNEKQT